MSLSSANVDEVIKKRILEKNDSGKQTLSLLYDDKATVIKNLIIFNDGIEKKLYSDRTNFADIYPFIPYQFNLLGSVLTSIRTHGASGKHLAEGERSMLALFKESAVKVMNDGPGTIVPFNMFYDALEQFLDHSHKGVISRALDNEYLNPNHDRECFDVNVLKTLFMIKYVKEIKANIENITSLMVSNVNDDRMALAQQVEDALTRLVRQTLVQKNSDIYVFLTDEEQEINRATVTVAIITSVLKKVGMDTHIEIGKEFGLKELSMIMLEQLRTVDKLEELGEFIGTVATDEDKVIEIQRGLKFALGIPMKPKQKRTRMVMSLCPHCREEFINVPDNIIKRVYPLQAEKEPCDKCKVRYGYDYLIMKRYKHNEQRRDS